MSDKPAKTKKWNWSNLDTGELVTTSEQDWYDRGSPKCPKCNYESEYTEGQIDETEQGNAIYGYSYYCPECGIGTEAVEIDHRAPRDSDW